MDSFERVVSIVGQMEDYRNLGLEWKPYLMFSATREFESPVVSTDGRGFRYTVTPQARYSSTSFRELAQVDVLLGGSVAFGVGASSDAATLASLLATRRGEPWLNWSSSAFNSFQELLAFLSFYPENARQVLLFSGVNDLVFSSWIGLADDVTLPVLGQRHFLERMNGRDRAPERDRYEWLLNCAERNLRIWADLARSRGFSVRFVFQPVAPLLGKQLVPEEQELVELLDGVRDASWRQTWERVEAIGARYVADLARLCGAASVPFLDLNAQAAFREPRWLFIDRVHLTDAGYALAAEIVDDWIGR